MQYLIKDNVLMALKPRSEISAINIVEIIRGSHQTAVVLYQNLPPEKR